MRVPGTRDKALGKLALTREGLSFIRRSQVLAGAFAADVSATFFALPLSLFPAINAERFGGDPRILGLMPAAIGVGGMLTAVLAGPVRHVSRHGLAMIAAVCVWGLSFAVFAVTPWLWLTLLSLAIAGAADTYTVVFRQVIVQTVTPVEFRGRVNAADYVVGAGGGQLGSLESGVLGSLTSPAISALSGGLLTIAAALALGAALPGFRRYRAPDPAADRPPNRPSCPSSPPRQRPDNSKKRRTFDRKSPAADNSKKVSARDDDGSLGTLWGLLQFLRGGRREPVPGRGSWYARAWRAVRRARFGGARAGAAVFGYAVARPRGARPGRDVRGFS